VTPLLGIKKTALIIGLLPAAGTAYGRENIQKLFMGIEMNNVLCGYSEILIDSSLRN
jgi:hypothetical protein